MAPESMLRKPLREGTVQAIAPGRWLDVPLYWQHWSVRSTTLERLTGALLAGAAKALRQRD